jgi:hypothetical protein
MFALFLSKMLIRLTLVRILCLTDMKPNGTNMSQLYYQLCICGFFMVLTVNSDYFLKQH